MALSDDQKAILRLLSQRGADGYSDLAALLGTSVEEVHSRAKAAAADLESEGIPAPDIPAPIGAGGSPSGAPPSVAPKGEPPAPAPAPPRPKPAPSSKPPKPIPHHDLGHGPKAVAREAKLLEKRGLWAILAGAAIVVLFVVILFVSGGDSGSDGTTTTASENAKQSLEEAAAKQGKQVTKAVLNPVDGSEASGLAIFGRVKKSLALQLYAQGLEKTGDGEAYTVWLAASEDKMLPLASTPVEQDGKISAQVEVPVEVLAYLANETFDQIAITKTDDSQLEASLGTATKEKKAPTYTGTPVLRGAVTGPVIEAASRLEAKEAEEGK